MLRLSTLLAVAAALAALAGPSQAQVPFADLKTVSPPGGKAGETIEVTIGGADLDEVDRLLFSSPKIAAQAKMSEPSEFEKEARPLENRFVVTIAPDTPPGIYEVRAVGRFGASNPRAFAVASRPEATDNGANRALAQAQEIALPVTINGQADAGARDFYKVSLSKGQRITIDCLAQRIDSRMEPAVAVLSASGRPLASARDPMAIDSTLVFEAPEEGEYVIVVNDFVFGGGAEHFYRLGVDASPQIDYVFPPAGQPGQAGSFALFGRNLPGGKPVEGMAVEGQPLERLDVTIPLEGGEATRQLSIAALADLSSATFNSQVYRLDSPQGASNPVMIGFAAAPVVAEQEPNDTGAAANVVSVPCDLAGQFYPAGDIDWIAFEGKKGEIWRIEVVSHQQGLRTDPAITIQKVTRNDQGEEQVADVAQVDDPADRNNRIGTDFDPSTDDPSYRLEVPEDATYRIRIVDQFGSARTDPRGVYRLVIRPEQPDFQLLATPEAFNQGNANQTFQATTPLRRGGSELFNVRVFRQDDFDGEITVTAEGLPPGVTAIPAVLAGPADSAPLVLTAAEDAAAWAGPIQIVGRGKIGEAEVTRQARYGVVVWGTANRQQTAPGFRLTRELALAVVDKEKMPALVQVAEDKVHETSLGGKLDIPVNVVRRDGFNQDVTLTGVGQPQNLQIPNVAIKGADAAGTVTFTLNNANIKPGLYTFYLRGQSKWPQYPRNPDAVKLAEERQKQIDELNKQLAEKANQAKQQFDEAVKAAQEMTTKLKQAEQAKTAAANVATQMEAAAKQAADKLAAAKDAAEKGKEDQNLAAAAQAAQQASDQAAAQSAEAAEKLKAADAALAEAQKAMADAEAARQAAEKANTDAQNLAKQAADHKKAVDQQADAVKKANAPKDVNLTLYSTPVKLKIHPTALRIAEPAAVSIKQGEKAEAAVSVERLYGFDDQVQLTLQPPQGVGGVSAPAVNVAKGQNEGKLQITVAANAPAGEHVFTVQASYRFNNVALQDKQTVTLKIEPMAESK